MDLELSKGKVIAKWIDINVCGYPCNVYLVKDRWFGILPANSHLSNISWVNEDTIDPDLFNRIMATEPVWQEAIKEPVDKTRRWIDLLEDIDG